MTDQTDEYNDTEDQQNSDDDTSQQQGDEPKRNWRRDLEEKAAKADRLERELAFSKVRDLDESNPQHKFFMDNYKGDVSRDAIESAARELGFLKTETTSVPQDKIDTHARMDAASFDAEPGAVQGSDAAQLKAAMEADSSEAFYAAARAGGWMQNSQ